MKLLSFSELLFQAKPFFVDAFQDRCPQPSMSQYQKPSKGCLLLQNFRNWINVIL